MTTLTQKETMLLKDEKAQEDICVKKYTKYSNEAQDPALKQLFTSIRDHEQQHVNTLNSILNGEVPNMNQQNQQGQGQQASQNQQPNMQNSTTPFNQNDADLCHDALSTEKYVSSTYNTTIFECTQANIRQVLNHIQKEEQEHGEQIFNYMNQKGYYKVQ
ncbi:spore coat protein [Clostridium frigidicarnis]|uniref:Spore coat protein CotF n=1 Tax=Clostridium frigidicarnis TaxID=84698 RepID=A0A1I0YLX8_9CLOT|nr:spore coat protein [Clostridium frigidicarnis]SFB13318.1 Spore coat protein CotF [Clostridium frigidicarnis]